jgi:hypothetical protein
MQNGSHPGHDIYTSDVHARTRPRPFPYVFCNKSMICMGFALHTCLLPFAILLFRPPTRGLAETRLEVTRAQAPNTYTYFTFLFVMFHQASADALCYS